MSTNITQPKTQSTPKLRFTEFSSGWEKKKMGEITKINQGLQIPISQRFLKKVDNSYFYITNEFLKENSQNEYYIKNPSQSVLCNKDDILMTRTGNTGHVVTNVSGAFHNNFFKIKYDKKLIEKDFLYYFLILPKTKNIILRLAGSSTIPDLNHGDFYRVKIDFPSLSEQQKIASFLGSVDEWILNLKKQKESLESYKKGMMQKIFSQETRFPGFSEKWEEKKLGNVGKIYNGLSGKNGEDFGDGEPFITYKQIFDKSEIDVQKFSLVNVGAGEKQNKAQFGDVFFTTSSETPGEVGFASVLLNKNISPYLNSFSFGFRPNSIKELNPYFSKLFFRNSLFRKDVVKLAQGSTRYNISKVEFMKIKVFLPSAQEQQKIADFLTSVDNLIELKEKQITQAENWKKGLMQGLFV